MGALVTTSKAARGPAVRLGMRLASLLPGAVFERRGKKSVEDVIGRARLQGKKRAVFVHERAGSVSALEFARVRASNWEWLGSPRKVAGVAYGRGRVGRAVCCVSFAGAKAAPYADLFGVPGPACTDDGSCGGTAVTCAADGMVFSTADGKVLELVLANG